MKTAHVQVLAGILSLATLGVYLHTVHAQDHGIAHHGSTAHPADAADAPVTISFAQNDDFNLCNEPFWLAYYEMMQEVYAVGIENVTTASLQEKTFAFIRSWPEFTPEQAERRVEHVKDIPGQFVTIIRDDPTVLDSCANFSVAAVGPP